MQIPFGTKIIIGGQDYYCYDRGGAINYLGDGTFWVDMLVTQPVYSFGSVVEAVMVKN